MDDPEALANIWKSKRYFYADERRFQDGLAAVLEAHDLSYDREVKIVGGRIDFVVGSIGVEVKIKGAASALLRQVQRYAEEPTLTSILVVTTSPAHARISHDWLHPKPLSILTLGAFTL